MVFNDHETRWREGADASAHGLLKKGRPGSVLLLMP